MIEQDKQLLINDLCARLPYNPYIFIEEDNVKTLLTSVEIDKCGITQIWYDGIPYPIETIKPYLRSMSSMTDEERKELSYYENSVQITDFYYSHHIDCRFMIEKGLAVVAPEGMYTNYNN